MKVYAVEYGYYDDHGLEGIFSSEEFAYDYAQMCGTSYDVIELIIDDPKNIEWFEKEKAKRARRKEQREASKTSI